MNHFSIRSALFSVLAAMTLLTSCASMGCGKDCAGQSSARDAAQPEWFSLRPEIEKDYGYFHAVRIGHELKISGAVSMDERGRPIDEGDLLQQIKNCYADLETVLKHFDCTFDNVVFERVYTTDMNGFLRESGYRSTIYTKHWPAISWVEVKGMPFPQFMVMIDLEAYIP